MPDVKATVDAAMPGGPQAKATPGFAQIVQEFGAQGSGPGQMDDARYVAIDSDGNLWTADYQDGRVQQFDSSGKFMQLIQVPPDENDNTLIEGLAADLKGNLYVTRGGDILKYSSADGSLVKTFPGKFPGTRYQALAVDAQNNLYAIHSTASDNAVIKLNSDGKQLARWDDIVTKVNKKDAAMDLGIAVDGLGNIYIASSFGNQVYSYDAKGKFIDRFGQEGNEPGQLSFPKDIAVDGQKQLYVHHTGGIDQFDTSGRFIGKLPIDYTKGFAAHGDRRSRGIRLHRDEQWQGVEVSGGPRDRGINFLCEVAMEYKRGVRLFWPIILIGVGAILLLSNLGYIQGNPWTIIFQLWPVLLIALGLEILFGGSTGWRAVVSALLGLALVGGILWVLVAQPAIPGLNFNNSNLQTTTISEAAERRRIGTSQSVVWRGHE